MSKKILFVSQYASSNLIGGNNNVYRQAATLKNTLKVDIEILTWPENDGWSGPIPIANNFNKFSLLNWHFEGLKYHVVALPKRFTTRVLTDSEWQEAVEIGCEILKKIDPGIVHLQHWHGLWWILESANRLSIPTVYSAHDWGIGCLRTILVKGEGGLCNGDVNVKKCTLCIWKGRNWIGKVNEALVSTKFGERLLERIDQGFFKKWLDNHGAVRLGLRKRVTLNHERAKAILSNLSSLIIPNIFGKNFYMQFGISETRIHVEPWYYDLTVPLHSVRPDSTKIVLGYIGRISPEKGVKRIFEALLSESLVNPIHLVIAGAIDNEYAKQLYSKFKDKVGKHTVEWMGWIPHNEVHRFYEKVDSVIISSEWIENGPLTLIEAYAFKRPVIITDTPTVRDLVSDRRTGYLTTIGSTESLVQALKKASLKPNDLFKMRNNIPSVKSSVDYVSVIKAIYESIDKKNILS